MTSLKALKRNSVREGRIQSGAEINSKLGLHLPADRLAIVLTNVLGLTEKAVVNPMSDPDLLADVQELLIVDKDAALHVTLDPRAPRVADYLIQGIAQGFCLVLVDTSTERAVALVLGDSARTKVSEAEARRGFAPYGSQPSQAERYVASVARLGFFGCADSLRALQTPRNANQIYFCPVFSDEHLPFMDCSPDDLVKRGRDVPTMSSFAPTLDGKPAVLLGAGTFAQMMAMAESYAKPRH